MQLSLYEVCVFQVAEMSGRLQQAQQANSSLLAQVAAQQPRDNVGAAMPASRQPMQSTGLQDLHTNAAAELVDTNMEEEHQHNSDSKCVSASTSSRSSEQLSTAPEVECSRSKAEDSCMDRQVYSSMACTTSMQKTLEGLAETLSQDAIRLQKVVEAQSERERHDSNRPFNWGFPVRDVGASPGPSRPVTAAPGGSALRPNRQWSAGSARHESRKQGDSEQQNHCQDRPSTAGDDPQQFRDADTPFYNAAARSPRGRRSRHHMDSSWRDPVPPSRMPEEVLRQAREDYMLEKNRVREMRLQELAAKGNSNAATSLDQHD